jgi:hypothetical protein
MSYPPKTLFEQQCMTFSAVIKAFPGQLNPGNVLGIWDHVWRWTWVTRTDATGATSVTEAKETQEEQPPPASTNGTQETVYFITEPQRRRLFAIAKGAGIESEKLDEFLRIEYDIASTKKIPRDQYEEICEVVKTGELPY